MDKKITPMEEKPAEESVLADFKSAEKEFMAKSTFFMALIFTILLGITSGYVGASAFHKSSGSPAGSSASPGNSSQTTKGMVVGSNDTKTFKDSVQGVLKAGGIDGEGQYHLVRPGGDSQNVYLTSSIVDLSQFIDHKIKVSGQTQTAQKAGWLMDVGRVEILE